MRAISSAGSEHLVYTEGVGGSNPSSPTKVSPKKISLGIFYFMGNYVFFHLHIIFCFHRKYYIGSTKDVYNRLEAHLCSKKGFTSRASDWELKYCESFVTRSLAIKSERQIKNWKSRLIIEKLIG